MNTSDQVNHAKRQTIKGAGMMTPTDHEKREWSRLATSAYAAGLNDLGHKFSGAASIRNGESIALKSFDELQTTYRAWLVGGFDDIKRVQKCLDFILENRVAKNLSEINWRKGVEDEARTLGLLPKLAAYIGCNCKPGIDSGIVYGADAVEAF